MTTAITPLYNDDPHDIVASRNVLEVTTPRDFDLTSTLQFVAGENAVQFDFSAYVFITEDGKNIEEERQRVADEIRAFNVLVDQVTLAHQSFMEGASKALDLIAGVQQA